ncbi:MAG: nucleotidyltransferase family protein [Polyangiaceae bacterium]|nr:nucleotidyltransferase family protein [Polyangiaceae bacterium]
MVSEPAAASAAHNLRLLAELGLVLDTLATARVPAIVLKGLPDLARFGGSLAERRLLDNDVLVRRADADAATRALESLGYVALRLDARPTHERALARPDTAGGRLVCELHEEPFPPEPFDRAGEGPWVRAARVEAHGRSFPVLDPEWTVLTLAAHAWTHDFSEARTITALGRAWRALGPQLDAGRVATLARHHGLARVLAHGLAAAGVAPPAELAARPSGWPWLAPRRLGSDATTARERYLRWLGSLTLLGPRRAGRAVRQRALAGDVGPAAVAARTAAVLRRLARGSGVEPPGAARRP